ncbi:peptidyl-prolyl cis-trans isomerase B (cyclophilin B) [Paraoerskovia marina]|uniref:peptidylprolyl isomerase n=1 Tax=Paraoerskovia marina TaxID=545619 RepID=A0A1H1SLZ3_9CELL|nr:peptidylprolyl isomerase [Paraoerskovia marina]SDS48746.1 peptidyl-prolyl cis-trans isomerase B (cyclophilin B) [Paraoerskovia marina]
MSASKRDRERAAQRRREQKRQAALDARAAQRRRTWAFVAIGAVLLLVGLGSWWLVSQDGDSDTDVPTSAPDPSTAESREWTGELTTSVGEIGVTLDGAAAPAAVANFVALADAGYFDGTDCHRLTTAGIWVLQCGDPTGTGTGGPGYSFGPIENAPADGIYPAGTIAMARTAEPDSMGSQFFIVYQDTELPTDGGGYTVFGTVTSGLDAVQAVADEGTADGASDGSPATPVTIEGVEIK